MINKLIKNNIKFLRSKGSKKWISFTINGKRAFFSVTSNLVKKLYNGFIL